ncbi:MAG: type II toxin-antitoxin system RelE/ParE family toxin [Limosilactobacillus sp.]|jgi:hypothetical protein|uniref:type II toxin-antitoxin system RelE/ParE family toxin n=1 Tax=Limosilactobacillus sp. TaxID=2773925 RepID=UPI0025C591BB|nr:type II toxin-antitoxin system RelE/ParE family toxin [Limosilactobacillus sp.]MCI1974506.1 type II toxin-antitoxin system RelE/ParE family toxin [Limosilactobacillus sp.]MCI2030641.1 type II toxin-antitoxin system RelE/ParE family toxin [Limosilactobacillus sp.]
MNTKVKFVFSRAFMEEWFSCGLTKENRQELIDNISYYLSNAPDNNHGKKFPGEIIEGTGGAIKYRFTPEDYHKGKSGSFRTIYFVYDVSINHLFFLTVYPKNRKASLSKREKHAIKKFIENSKRKRKEK